MAVCGDEKHIPVTLPNPLKNKKVVGAVSSRRRLLDEYVTGCRRREVIPSLSTVMVRPSPVKIGEAPPTSEVRREEAEWCCRSRLSGAICFKKTA
jgi:hypothetical protein